MIAAMPLRLLAALCVVGHSLQQNSQPPLESTPPLSVQAVATAAANPKAAELQPVVQQSVTQPSTVVDKGHYPTRAEQQLAWMDEASGKMKHLQKRFDAISTILQDSIPVSESLTHISHTYSPILDIGGWSLRRDNVTGKNVRIPEPTSEELERWRKLQALEESGMRNLTKRLNKVKALVADVETTVTGVDADNAVGVTELKVKASPLDPHKQYFRAPKVKYNFSMPAPPLQRSVNWFNKSNFNESKPDDTVQVASLRKELAEQRMMNQELLSQVDELKQMVARHVIKTQQQQQQPVKKEAAPQDATEEKAEAAPAEEKPAKKSEEPAAEEKAEGANEEEKAPVVKHEPQEVEASTKLATVM